MARRSMWLDGLTKPNSGVPRKPADEVKLPYPSHDEHDEMLRRVREKLRMLRERVVRQR